MVSHPKGCGKYCQPGETESWLHWMVGFGIHCEWVIDEVEQMREKCSFSGDHDGVFHKRCLQREGFIW